MLVDQKFSHFHEHLGTSAQVVLQSTEPQVQVSVLHPQRLFHLGDSNQTANQQQLIIIMNQNTEVKKNAI